MFLYIQWAKLNPTDWERFDLSGKNELARLNKKAVPTEGDLLDNDSGWVNAINCQGVHFNGYDHYAVERINRDHLVITVWNDDPNDWGSSRFAKQYDFLTPAPDPAFGGRINTRQTVTKWATADLGWEDALPWEDFVPPPTNLTFHGIWMADELEEESVRRQSLHGWREWIQ